MDWFSVGGRLNRFDPLTKKSTRFPVRPGQSGYLQAPVVGDIIPAGSRIYLGTNAGLEYYDKATGKFTFVPLLDEYGDTIRYPVRAIAITRDGRIWMNRPDAGLRMYDPVEGSNRTYTISAPTGEADPRLTGIQEAPDGRLWMLNHGDLWSLSPDREHLQRHRMHSLETGNPIDEFLDGLFIGRDGLIWVNHYFFDPRRILFDYHQVFSSRTGDPLLIEEAEALNDSTLLIRTYEGYFLYDLHRRSAQALIIEETRPLREADINPADPSWLVFWHKRRLVFYRSDADDVYSIQLEKDGKPYDLLLMHQAFDHDGDLWIVT